MTTSAQQETVTRLADDATLERGAASLITGDAVSGATALVKEGRIIPLAVVVRSNDPTEAYFRTHTDVLKTRDGGDFERGTMMTNSLISSHRDYLLSAIHGTTTHIDALAHISVGGKLYGGISARTVRTDGARQLDVTKVPYLVSRGVLIDVAKHRNVPQLEPGSVISGDEIEACLKAQGDTLQPGDIALIRTGWITRRESDPAGFSGAAPGIGLSAARLLGEAGVTAVGADTWLVEAYPYDEAAGIGPLPAHQELVYRRGVYMLKLLNLEELAASGRLTCLLAVAPLKITGACGSPVNPLAII